MKKGILVIFLIVVVVFGYIVFSMLHGLSADNVISPKEFVFDFNKWSPVAAYLYVTSIITLPIIISAFLFTKKEIKSADIKLAETFNIKEYQVKNLFDSVISHYTNVATVGLLITLIMFCSKMFIETSSYKVGVSVTFIAIAFFLYTIFFTKIGYKVFQTYMGSYRAKVFPVPIPYNLILVLALISLDFLIIFMFVTIS